MRFHLPAILIADLEGTYSNEVLFILTYLGDDNLSHLDLLTDEQLDQARAAAANTAARQSGPVTTVIGPFERRSRPSVSS